MPRAALAGLALLTTLFAIGCYDPQVVSGGFVCDPNDNPSCPVGFICVDSRCINGAPLVRVDKTGPTYTGQRTDPGLATTADCPDESLEPNDGATLPDGKPVIVTAVPDATNTPKLTKMAICPKGVNPSTKRHDVDYFRIDIGAGVTTMMAEVFYDITYGDLDVAILDAGGTMLGSDGTATSNACTTGAVTTAGTYFVVVVGANDFDVNRYDLRVTTYTKPTACTSTPTDMGAP